MISAFVYNSSCIHPVLQQQRSCKDETDRKLWEAEYIEYRSPTINTQPIKCNNKKVQFSVNTWVVF